VLRGRGTEPRTEVKGLRAKAKSLCIDSANIPSYRGRGLCKGFWT